MYDGRFVFVLVFCSGMGEICVSVSVCACALGEVVNGGMWSYAGQWVAMLRPNAL